MNPIKKGAEAKASALGGNHLPIQSHSINRNQNDRLNIKSKFCSDNEISDAPAADSLTNITVKAITVDGTPIETQQFADGKLTINWAKEGKAGDSLYKNGAKLVITYTGVVADTAAIDGAGNKNTVTVKPILDDGTSPDPSQYTDDETFFTYAIAIKKVDQKGRPLAGAKFQLPFYVKSTATDDGAYIYAGTTAGDGLVNELTTPADGVIIVKGLRLAITPLLRLRLLRNITS